VKDTILRNEEKAVFALRTLYENFGYTQYRMSRFEEYDLYQENKQFLAKGEIITFNDRDGKLLALKPDVTLSIVKNARAGEQLREYYNENVYRTVNGEYREIMQVGLECIGDIDLYSTCEVLRLAKKSLSIISDSAILDMTNAGFVNGLLAETGLAENEQAQLTACIAQKNPHDLASLCASFGVSEELAARLTKTASLYGSFAQVEGEAAAMVMNEEMQNALDELRAIDEYFTAIGENSGLNVDFSLMNDMQYYNGIVFRGYVEGVPAGVLSGGRYDRLLGKMGKGSDMGAIGFAIYMNLLDLYFDDRREFDVDILVTYDSGADMASLSRTVDMLMGGGRTVRVQKQDNGKVRCRERFHFGERGLEIRG